MGKPQYLIHTCKSRLWYVKQYLVPSMREQGIKNILIYTDTGDGQLQAFIKSFEKTKGLDTWHLQDDVIISSRFKELTEKHEGLVCGFCNSYSKAQPGKSNVFDMWYSMPCIRIPGILFEHFVEWIQEDATQSKYHHYIVENKHDDVLFQQFLLDNYPRLVVLNLAPNLVNHIDHLLGGSLINQNRNRSTEYIMSRYWDEPRLLVDIENSLKQNTKCG